MTQANYSRVIKFGASAQVLRYEYPNQWDAENITGVDLEIADKSGSVLLSSDACTIYAATALDAAAPAGARTITLDSAATDLARGDRIRIAGPDEDCTVESYNSTTKVATLRRSLLFAHDDASVVSGLWATYELDASGAEFSAGLECVLEWTPDSSDLPAVELGIVEAQSAGVSEYRERFAALYPIEYELAETRLDSVYAESLIRLKYRLSGRNLNVNRVVDQSILQPAILDYMRWLIVLSGGDAFATERESAWEAYLRSEESLCSQPIWTDDNHDLVEAEDEVQTHEPYRRARGL
jgi:hypothetical protein